MRQMRKIGQQVRIRAGFGALTTQKDFINNKILPIMALLN